MAQATLNMYRRTRDITPYWLFVKDIQYSFRITIIESDRIASLIWPTFSQREEYKAESKRRKEKLKKTGPFPVTPSQLLNNHTRAWIQRLLLDEDEHIEMLASDWSEEGCTSLDDEDDADW